MIYNILAENTIGAMLAVIMLVIYGFIFCLIIIGLIRLVRYLGIAGKEQKLIRMELSKVAEEVHLIREELKNKHQ